MNNFREDIRKLLPSCIRWCMPNNNNKQIQWIVRFTFEWWLINIFFILLILYIQIILEYLASFYNIRMIILSNECQWLTLNRKCVLLLDHPFFVCVLIMLFFYTLLIRNREKSPSNQTRLLDSDGINSFATDNFLSTESNVEWLAKSAKLLITLTQSVDLRWQIKTTNSFGFLSNGTNSMKIKLFQGNACRNI